ncbi:MAG: NAD(P)H-binding protein [Gammaproteobacteria bacterium]
MSVAARHALIAGATGLVGRRLLQLLLDDPAYGAVTAVGRRPPGIPHAKLNFVPAALSEMEPALAGGEWDAAFCCLGTTMKTAGTRAAFRAVDLEGVTAFARAAKAGNSGFFGLVSAAGASRRSPSFYLSTKGQAEDAVEALGFPSLALMRPGVLTGQRQEFRPAERFATMAAPLTDRLFLGPLAAYRSVPAATVAAALLVAARQARPGTCRLDPAAMKRLAAELPKPCGPARGAPHAGDSAA